MTYDGYAWRRAKGIAIASDVHAQISRNSLLWSKIEPEKGSYDWSVPDSVVSELVAKGIEPLFVVWGSPSWANGVPSTIPGAVDYVPTSPAAFATWLGEYEAFVKAAVLRYQGKVEKWEIWNEENEHFTWKPGPDISQYATFFRAIRSAILSVDPQAQVAIGGLAGLCCSVDISGMTFLKGLIDANLSFDYVAIHPYSGKDQSPGVHLAWENNFDDIGAVHDLLVSAGRPVPLWVTEWGWSSAEIGDDLQAQYVGQSLELLKTHYPYVSVATYFLDVDHDTTYQQGLFDVNYDPKPAAAAFADFMSSLGGQNDSPTTRSTPIDLRSVTATAPGSPSSGGAQPQPPLTQTADGPNAAADPGTSNKKIQSAPVTKAPPALATLRGKPLVVGQTLTAGDALAQMIKKSLPGIPVPYQWQAARKRHRYVNLAAQTHSTLKLSTSLVGRQVRLRVTVRTVDGVRTVTSKATVVIRAAPRVG